MINEQTQQRYLDYLMTYTNTILKYSEELKDKCKKKSSGEVKINWAKYTYFGISNGVSIMNKKNYLEMSFYFNTEENSIFFNKTKFHNYIESDLNASGLWKNFTSNIIVRTKELNECFDKLCSLWMINKKDDGFVILTNEMYS